MITIITALGRVFSVAWVGISDFDGSLRFEITDGDLTELFDIFRNPNHTKEIIRKFDEYEKSFTGFTVLKGIEMMPSGSVVVRLLKGAES